MRLQDIDIIQLGGAAFLKMLAVTLFIGVSNYALWQIVLAIFAAGSCLIASYLISKSSYYVKILSILALLSATALSFPQLASSPYKGIVGGTIIIVFISIIKEFNLQYMLYRRAGDHEVILQTVRCASYLLFFIGFFVYLEVSENLLSAIIVQLLLVLVYWCHMTKYLKVVYLWSFRKIFLISLPTIILVILCVVLNLSVSLALMLIALISIALLPKSIVVHPYKFYEWDFIFANPSRMLIITFLFLCVIGALILHLPMAAADGKYISLIDSAFTAVSAVCVTGLVVLDTSVDFSFLGQLFILLLIQLGGLGIMSISVVALDLFGQRLSIKHERLISSMGDSHNMTEALKLVLRYTFFCEATGAIILFILFMINGDGFFQALWRGIFTSISAFCNAGFALQSNSLIGFQSNPLILYTIGFLIIAGGLAPPTALAFCAILKSKPIPLSSRIALIVTLALIVFGSIFFIILEWNGALKGMFFFDKLNNAWFQSVTLRTAGFNSIELGGTAIATIILMIVWMFIGGSPGGTAGGIKTTTVGVLALTFWQNFQGKDDVIVSNQRIAPQTINRAISIIFAGIFVWFMLLLMLLLTQSMTPRDLFFEVTSALGTVGLSLNATGSLDAIGKVIIMLAMFVGRVGPVTIFIMLSKDMVHTRHICPEAKISLT